MKKRYILLIATFFNFIAWNYFGLALVIFIALSFHYLNLISSEKWYGKILFIFILMLLFNISSTFWLIEASWWEAVFAFSANSLVMVIPLFIVLLLKDKVEIFYSYTFFWLFFEVIHTKWDFSWPWLTYGNSLGNLHFFVQWYSISGVYGGSLWLIILGYFFYKLIFKCNTKRLIYQFFLILFTPIILSLYMYFFQKVRKDGYLKVLTYIPKNNNDGNYKKIKNLFFKLKDVSQVNFLVSPEIFLSKTNLTSLKKKEESVYLKKISKKLPNTGIFWGVELLNDKKELFNTIMYSLNGNHSFRTKKKYVPFREYIPSSFRRMIGANFYTKNEIDNHDYIVSKTEILPIVCYESIFSSFVAINSSNTKVIFLLASEEFMNNSYFGKKQYLNIVKLRAIENKRYLLKCSSTNGISCVINQKGDVIRFIKGEIEVIKIPKVKEISFYQKIISYL